jgi:hypothetical protein
MTSMTDGRTSNRHRRNARRKRSGPTLWTAILGGAVALILTSCGVPDHGEIFLSENALGIGCSDRAHCPQLTDEAEASRYYQAIGAEDADGNALFNFEQWKEQFGFASSTPIRAVYANKLDLVLGRNMNCWQPPASQRVACYVSNYAIPRLITYDFNNAVSDAIEGDINKSGATVAMVYDPNGIGVNRDKVAFYVFGPTDGDGNQPLVRSVALDYEGPKTVPRMCMSCHGGRYYEDSPGAPLNKHSVVGTSFLPFDVQSYYFSSGYDYRGDYPVAGPPGFDLDSQQEAFRRLNALVLATEPARAITDLINGLYSGSANTPGATIPDDTFIPSGWDIDTTSRNLYRDVYRKYCRTCHVANGRTFDEFRLFTPDVIVGPVCQSRIMPNAAIPFWGLWTDGVARSDLKEYLKDVAPNGCQ